MKEVTGLPRRPGWEPIAAAAGRLAAESDEQARRRVASGALDLATSIVQDLERSGMRRFARELAAETCDRCGRPGEKVEGRETDCPTIRCIRCRGLDDRVVPRRWTLPERAWPAPGAASENGDGRPLAEYWSNGQLEALMNAHHEPGYHGSAACSGTKGGWNHLLRALVAAWLHPDAGDGAGRLLITDVKEKWGALTIYAGPLNDVRAGSLRLATAMSTLVCEECGAPGELRTRRPPCHGVATACDDCAARLWADAATPLGYIRRILFEQQVHTGSPLAIEDSLREASTDTEGCVGIYATDARQRRCKH